MDEKEIFLGLVSFSVFVFRRCRAKCKLPRCLLFQAILRHAAELCVSTRCSSTRFGVGGAPTGREESGFNCPSCSCSSSRRSRLPFERRRERPFYSGPPTAPLAKRPRGSLSDASSRERGRKLINSPPTLSSSVGLLLFFVDVSFSRETSFV